MCSIREFGILVELQSSAKLFISLFNTQHLCCLFQMQGVNSIKQESIHQVSFILWSHTVDPVACTISYEALGNSWTHPPEMLFHLQFQLQGGR